jgi:ketosteroid isomerase-like protein
MVVCRLVDGVANGRDVVGDKRTFVWSYFELLSGGRVDDALNLLNDAGTWWNLIDRVAVPMPEYKQRIVVAAGSLPMTFTLHAAYETGDTVILEAESVATMPDGSTYNNCYCYVVTTFGDSILHVRVYPDTNVIVEMRSKMPTMREAFEQSERAEP